MEKITLGTNQNYTFQCTNKITISPEIELIKNSKESVTIRMPLNPGVYYAVEISDLPVLRKFIVTYVSDDEAYVYIYHESIVGYDYLDKEVNTPGPGCRRYAEKCRKYKIKVDLTRSEQIVCSRIDVGVFVSSLFPHVKNTSCHGTIYLEHPKIV